MKTLKIIGMFPLVLISATALAQGDNRAVPRGSGGGSSSDAGSRHTGGSSSGSTASSGSSSSGSSGSPSYEGSSSSSASQDAARRRPRPGTGTGDRNRFGNSGGDRYYGYPYSGYYYDPFSYSWGYPRSRSYGYGYGYYDYGYSYGDYYGYYPSSYSRSYRYRSGNIAQLRTLVEPIKTRVYVDGYYAGIADDFDGLLQRLNVSPGRHDITLKLEGYNSHTFAVYANREQTIKLRWDMVRGNAETRDSIGEESADYESRGEINRDLDSASNADRSREVDSGSPLDRRYVPPARDGSGGELQLEIEPPDASVYVDGEFFGKAAQLARIELAAGRHRIEVVRPGYKTEETEVEVEGKGEIKRVTVKLSRR